jgi:hypothetical protein
LRDAERWGDPAPLAGPAVFLPAVGEESLTDSARELATIARKEQYEGRRQDWQAILEGELKKAREIQQDAPGLANREIEQAVIATFLHSQPIGMRAQTRELMVMLGQVAPDRIELGKGLARWADVSWYLDDTFTAEKDGSVPKVWRLGSKPNLRQMHHDARTHIAGPVVEEVLETDPDGAALYNWYAHGELKAEGSSITEGLGQGRITANLEGLAVDMPYHISDAEALVQVFDLLRHEGLCMGASTGVNVAGAIRMARDLGPGHTIVTILCDYGTRYQSKLFNPAFLRFKGLPVPDWLEARRGGMPDVRAD